MAWRFKGYMWGYTVVDVALKRGHVLIRIASVQMFSVESNDGLAGNG